MQTEERDWSRWVLHHFVDPLFDKITSSFRSNLKVKLLAQIDQLAKLLHTVAVDLNWRIHTVAVGLDWLFGSYLVNFGPFYLIFFQLRGFLVKIAF